MTFREFVAQAEKSVRDAGILLPMAKLRNAISIAVHGRPYAAVLASEQAGQDCMPLLPVKHAAQAAERYRVDKQALERSVTGAVMRYMSRSAIERQLSALRELNSNVHIWTLAESVGDRQGMLDAAKSTWDTVARLRAEDRQIADLLVLRHRAVLDRMRKAAGSELPSLFTLSPSVAPVGSKSEYVLYSAQTGQPVFTFPIHPRVLEQIQIMDDSPPNRPWTDHLAD